MLIISPPESAGPRLESVRFLTRVEWDITAKE
jgi:hypothetical protein